MEQNLIVSTLEKEQITGSKAEMIEKAFSPMIEMLKTFESEYESIVKKEITKETSKEARELRLKLVKVRTGTAAVHKEQKAEYLRAGRAIDGVKNILEFAVVDKENALEKIEKHFENIEKERLSAIKIERQEKLRPFGYDYSAIDLSIIDESVFNTILIGAEKAYNDKIEAEEKEEKERIERQRIEAEEKEKQRLELERLRKENEEKEKQIAEEKAKAAAILKEQQEKARIEAERQAKIVAEEKAKNEKLKAELKAKEEAELKEKQRLDAEEKAKQAEIKKAAKAPDKQKLKKYVDSFSSNMEFSLVDREAQAVCTEIIKKFEAFKRWANEQIDAL